MIEDTKGAKQWQSNGKTMATRKRTKGQKTIYKAQHRKPKTEQQRTLPNTKMNTGALLTRYT